MNQDGINGLVGTAAVVESEGLDVHTDTGLTLTERPRFKDYAGSNGHDHAPERPLEQATLAFTTLISPAEAAEKVYTAAQNIITATTKDKSLPKLNKGFLDRDFADLMRIHAELKNNTTLEAFEARTAEAYEDWKKMPDNCNKPRAPIQPIQILGSALRTLEVQGANFTQETDPAPFLLEIKTALETAQAERVAERARIVERDRRNAAEAGQPLSL